MLNTAKSHWENIYQTKAPDEVSWFQEYPRTSMDFVELFDLPKHARIIDIGGGDGNLVDALLEQGFTNITVLDISANAIERARARLGNRANEVQWVVSDVTEFEPAQPYDFWHDRAAFHFLTTEATVRRYADIAQRAVRPGGYFVLGTFSEKGPRKCSGLDIQQYSRAGMNAVFGQFFRRIKCREIVHVTPFQTNQNFLFCSFRRRK
ncbi:MAG: class I SAM-dependent methyltransferase [Saprospiraceae bacterium]